MIWTGVTASAEPATSDARDTVQAIDAVVGDVLEASVPVAQADATVTTGEGQTVEPSSDASEGVKLTAEDETELTIGLPFAEEASAATVVDGTVVYDNNNGSTTTPLVHEDGSVQIVTTIADAGAPTDYEYQFDLVPGAALAMTEQGGVDIVEADGSVVRSIAAPWAIDSNGLPVPTWYEVYGNTLVQHVSHVGHATAYPVVADPKVTYGLVTGTIYFNKKETKDFSTAGITVSGCGVLAKVPAPLGTVLLAGCLVSGISWIVQATRAVNRGMCLNIKFTASLAAGIPGTWWPDIYGGGYCT